MFLTKYCGLRSSFLRTPLLRNGPVSSVLWCQEYSNRYYSRNTKFIQINYITQFKPLVHTQNVQRWYTRGLTEATENSDIDLKNVRALFPEPRMILNNLSAKTPEKAFDVYYKQYVAPKGVKKKSQNLDWTCTYIFVWPEKKKFECSALSKRRAGEQAALQALHWLLLNRKMDAKGNPLYDQNTIKEVQKGLNEPIRAMISQNSVERIQKIWEDYENGIREIYDRTAEEAKHKVITAPVQLMKDSTIDEDDVSEGEEDFGDEIPLSDQKTVHPVYGRVLTPPGELTLRKRAEAIRRQFEIYDESLTALPIDQFADKITSTLENTRVAVIVGAAGCGKSTRVPAMILRHCGVNATVVVSEPRRVAAIGLAERVASELGEEVGESIGYQVRLNSKPPRPPGGSVLFCTSGVLLNRLQTNPGLEGCTHVVIDEAHERDVNTDITLLLLKRALDLNSKIKIIVMSATLDTGVFTRYFGSCPIVDVPGRTFPVEISYLDDVEKMFNIRLRNTRASCQKEDGRPQLNIPEIVETIKAIDKHGKEGAILVFLPGWAEIKHAKQLLDNCFAKSGTHLILTVHSRLSMADQSRMFGIPAPGIRKVVLATAMAETSVTVADAVHVVDGGARRRPALTPTGTASLQTDWVSLAGANQRSGRAGRVQPGHCYRLYTKEKEAEFEPHTTPEILRVPLEQTVLNCKSYAPDDKAQDFLAQLPEPPSEKAVQFAVKDLIDIGALTRNEELTRLGKALSTLQLSPRVGLSLVHAAAVGTAVATSNIAAHSGIEVFYNAAERREEIREIKRKYSATSDHAALNWLQQDFEHEQRNSRQRAEEFCQRYQLKKERLNFVQSLSSLYLTQLLKTGLIEPNLEIEEINRFSEVDELSIATLLSGVNALLITKRHVKTKGKMRTVNELFSSTGDRAHIASDSVNHGMNSVNHGTATTTRLLAHTGGRHSAERRALLVGTSSALSALTPLLFSKGQVTRHDTDDADTTIISLPRHKLDIHVPTSQADILLRAREILWRTFQYYIDRDTKKLDYEEYSTVSRFKIRFMKAVGHILVEGHKVQFQRTDVDVEDIR